MSASLNARRRQAQAYNIWLTLGASVHVVRAGGDGGGNQHNEARSSMQCSRQQNSSGRGWVAHEESRKEVGTQV